MFWNRFDKKKPKKDGWYICTVEVKNQQRYVMDLYWYSDRQQFRDNRRQNVFDVYNVFNFENKELHSENLCNRTDGVIAWRKQPRTYMKGFVEKEFGMTAEERVERFRKNHYTVIHLFGNLYAVRHYPTTRCKFCYYDIRRLVGGEKENED